VPKQPQIPSIQCDDTIEVTIKRVTIMDNLVRKSGEIPNTIRFYSINILI